MNVARLLASEIRKNVPLLAVRLPDSQGFSSMIQWPVADNWILIDEAFQQAVNSHIEFQSDQDVSA